MRKGRLGKTDFGEIADQMLSVSTSFIGFDQNVEEKRIDIEIDRFPFEKQFRQQAKTLTVELRNDTERIFVSENSIRLH